MLGRAVAAELKLRYPDNTTGRVAQRLACSKKQAENLLSGHLSQRWHAALIQVLGLGFAIDVAARVAGDSLENFIRKRATEARREAEHWAALDLQEPPIAPIPDPPRSHRMADAEGWDRRLP